MSNLIKALARDGRVRVYVTNTTNITNEAIRLHDLWPSAASVLGKTLTIGAMMGAMLKGDEALTIKIDGNGPIGNVVVDGYSNGNVRGYVDRPHVHFSRKSSLDDITTLGYNGYIDVIKDLKLKDLYNSTVPLQTGDLAKDFTYYFAVSEQTPTLTTLGMLIDEGNSCVVSGGMIIQLMPDAIEEDIVYIESKADQLNNFSEILLKNKNLEEIIKIVFDSDFEVLDTINCEFKCGCSKEKFASGIATLGLDEINKIINEDEKAEIVCHYCNTQYYFSKDDLSEIIRRYKK